MKNKALSVILFCILCILILSSCSDAFLRAMANMVIVRFGVKDGIDFWEWISAFYNLAGNID